MEFLKIDETHYAEVGLDKKTTSSTYWKCACNILKFNLALIVLWNISCTKDYFFPLKRKDVTFFFSFRIKLAPIFVAIYKKLNHRVRVDWGNSCVCFRNDLRFVVPVSNGRSRKLRIRLSGSRNRVCEMEIKSASKSEYSTYIWIMNSFFVYGVTHFPYFCAGLSQTDAEA